MDVVGEDTFAVDLDNRDELPVGRLELWDAVDPDELEIPAAHLAHDLQSALAQVAAAGRVKDDPAQG